MNNFEKQYLKYKNKYLQLIGGAEQSRTTDGITTQSVKASMDAELKHIETNIANLRAIHELTPAQKIALNKLQITQKEVSNNIKIYDTTFKTAKESMHRTLEKPSSSSQQQPVSYYEQPNSPSLQQQQHIKEAQSKIDTHLIAVQKFLTLGSNIEQSPAYKTLHDQITGI